MIKTYPNAIYWPNLLKSLLDKNYNKRNLRISTGNL